MIIRLNGGVSKECITWLRENVGEGNIGVSVAGKYVVRTASPSHAWQFVRKEIPDEINPNRTWYAPTIEVFDEQKAAWFALRWT